MKSILRIVATVLVAAIGALGLLGPSVAAAPEQISGVGCFAYDISNYDEQCNHNALGRGPPAFSRDASVPAGQRADGRLSLDASARLNELDSFLTCVYDADVSPVFANSMRIHAGMATQEVGGSASQTWAPPDWGGVAAKTADDFGGPLSKAEYDGLQKALEPNKLNHLFAKQEHGLDGLVSRYGSQEAVVEQMYRGLSGAVTPGSGGLFSVTRRIGGQSVTIDGRVVNGIPRIGTAYIKP